jgi:flavin-dependent dehydrogenase
MIRDFVIIGGGAAGLAAAARLGELGAAPLLLEAGQYPAHKVCGEFFSPECLSFLEKWQIIPILIHQAHLNTSHQTLSFPFPQPAGSLSHIQFDPQLARYASEQGAEIRSQTKVKNLYPKTKPGEFHQIELTTGELIQTRSLLIATGRIPSIPQRPLHPSYIGIKAHFKNIPIKHTLEMFSFPEAYVGIAPIEEEKVNLACLVSHSYFEKMGSIEALFQDLMKKNALFKEHLSTGQKLFSEWMHAFIPSFGIKKTPDWLDTYFIGDAAGTIPPASGSGLSMAITSGSLAAEYAIIGNPIQFKQIWKSRYARQIYCGKIIHKILLNPALGNKLFRLASRFPILTRFAFTMTRSSLE